MPKYQELTGAIFIIMIGFFFTVFDKCHRSEHIFQPLSDYFLSISVNNIVQIICCISILAQSSKAL